MRSSVKRGPFCGKIYLWKQSFYCVLFTVLCTVVLLLALQSKNYWLELRFLIIGKEKRNLWFFWWHWLPLHYWASISVLVFALYFCMWFTWMSGLFCLSWCCFNKPFFSRGQIEKCLTGGQICELVAFNEKLYAYKIVMNTKHMGCCKIWLFRYVLYYGRFFTELFTSKYTI